MKLPEIVETRDGPLAMGSSPELLGELLTELDNVASDAGVSIEDWFRTGLQASEIRDPLSSVGLSAPDEVIVWFSWHNGYSRPFPHITPTPVPRFSMLSLDSALAAYRQEIEFVEAGRTAGTDVELELWGTGPGWLRLDQNAHGLVIDCSSNASPPRIRFATEDFPYRKDLFRAVSLCTYVTWTLYGLRHGGYIYNASNREWEVDVTNLAPSQLASNFF